MGQFTALSAQTPESAKMAGRVTLVSVAFVLRIWRDQLAKKKVTLVVVRHMLRGNILH